MFTKIRRAVYIEKFHKNPIRYKNEDNQYPKERKNVNPFIAPSEIMTGDHCNYSTQCDRGCIIILLSYCDVREKKK